MNIKYIYLYLYLLIILKFILNEIMIIYTYKVIKYIAMFFFFYIIDYKIKLYLF